MADSLRPGGADDACDGAESSRPDDTVDVDKTASDLGVSLALRALLACMLSDLWGHEPEKFARMNTALVQQLADALARLPTPDPLVSELYGRTEAHASAFLDQVFLMARTLATEPAR